MFRLKPRNIHPAMNITNDRALVSRRGLWNCVCGLKWVAIISREVHVLNMFPCLWPFVNDKLVSLQCCSKFVRATALFASCKSVRVSKSSFNVFMIINEKKAVVTLFESLTKLLFPFSVLCLVLSFSLSRHFCVFSFVVCNEI